jgi:hypothetical protein
MSVCESPSTRILKKNLSLPDRNKRNVLNGCYAC